MINASVDLAILVALPEEFEQLLTQLYGAPDVLRDLEYGNYYYRFRLPSEHHAPTETVACYIGGMGPDRSGRQMERLLQRWSPRVTAVVGICGALHHDVCLGDVIVPNRVDAYLTTTKTVPAGDGHFYFQHRGTEYECDHGLVEEVRHLRFAHRPLYERWQSECSARAAKLLAGHLDELARKGLWSHRPRIHTGRIASGPVVSSAASFKAWLGERSSEFAAIEMEAAGVAAAAAERVSRARFIAVRGVSDLADERKSGFDGVRAGSIRTAAMSNALGLLGTLASLGAFSPDVLNHGNKLLVAGHGNAAPETSKVEDLTGNLIAWMLRPLPSGSDLSGICILFVDDESNILELLGRFASDRGAKSLLANDGIEALDFLAKCAQVDIVVTDLYMPRMDGFSLAQTIAAKWPTLPVIFQSGYLDLANLDRINKVTNCVAALSKPYDREYIVSVIADVYRDNIRQVLVTALPELSQCYDLLFDCRSHIASFMRSFNGVSLFETAFRHKIKDSVASFARTIISGANPKLAVDKLAHELSKLTSLLRGAKVSQPHALIEFFETFVKDMRKQTKGIDLRLDLDPEVAVHLEPDSAMLICIALIELVDNAVEALNGKGEVRVVLSRLEVRRCILLQVCSPTGPLDEELAERIFEEGYSTKGPERGMGLSILRRLAERLGGHLNLSQSDGVEFCITLPFLRTEP